MKADEHQSRWVSGEDAWVIGWVIGEVCLLNDPPSALAVLDAYEGLLLGHGGEGADPLRRLLSAEPL